MSLTTAEARTALAAAPRLTTTVAKEYVHRDSVAEVFLTGCDTRDGVNFSLTGQWPRAHTMFRSLDGASHDPLQVAETFRQAGIYISHVELGVPLGHKFVMSSITYTTDTTGLRIEAGPTDFDLDTRCTEIVRRRGVASRMAFEFALRRSGRPMASGTGQISVIPPAVYNRLRQNRTVQQPSAAAGTAPDRTLLPPSMVGRTFLTDVVLSAVAGSGSGPRWLLTPDLNHPILFDHKGDHVPGMVLLEAARQAACAVMAPHSFVPAAAANHFHQYAELDRPCWIEVTRVEREAHNMVTLEVTGRQDGKDVFTSVLTGPVG
ncbi:MULTISPECIES: ScbA/BarX family gamma-butyrolactone biosynthesis protein [unclassified Streptomyces]|uniref:ScbA/BarX family gamma-butyrolactone biosynthesis protein n=1 Tax=unclassified Streptomyces TaxID=2593676 RepID=UPI000DAC3A65|nr:MULTISPECIES: ScbA/BarX family gamma-butyrolactone biosynthesis protein [unclassified Streptomyces]PZT71816.1 hypothetical protein DNK55_31300 [Streptomyces sp. AC1-42T]PZT73226.1 hypothetical protein DNK56_33775 [Streptomyces sp. AC1-42W]